MKRLKKKVKFLVALMLLCFGTVFALSVPAAAAGKNPYGNDAEIAKEWEQLEGEKAYILSYKNYELHFRELGLLEVDKSLMKGLGWLQFDYIKQVGMLTSQTFYLALHFNLAELFSSQIDELQRTLRGSVFEPLFFIGFIGSAIIIFKRMQKGDMMGSFGQILKVIGVFVLSLLIVRESGTVLSNATLLTSRIGAQMLTGENDTTAYAADAAATIWVDMVHRLWEYLEFGTDDHTEEQVAVMLSGSEPDINALIAGWEGDAFSDGGHLYSRVGLTILYMILMTVKCVFYIIMGVLLLLLQLTAVFYVLMAPLVLILTMIPGYEGALSRWLQKLFESQLSVLILYLFVGVLLKIDQMLYAELAMKWGFMLVILIETVLFIGAIIKRNELMGAFNRIGVGGAADAGHGLSRSAHAAKAAMLHTVMQARQLTRYADLASRGISESGAKNVGENNSAEKKTDKKTGNKAGKAPERPVLAVRQEAMVQSADSRYSPQTSYNAPKEPLIPNRVSFIQREVVFNYEPSGVDQKPAYEAPTMQRPRLDHFDADDPARGQASDGWQPRTIDVEPGELRQVSSSGQRRAPERPAAAPRAAQTPSNSYRSGTEASTGTTRQQVPKPRMQRPQSSVRSRD